MSKPYRPLNKAEQQALASYEKKCAVVRDKVRAPSSDQRSEVLVRVLDRPGHQQEHGPARSPAGNGGRREHGQERRQKS